MYDRVGLLSVNGRRKVAGDGCKGYIFYSKLQNGVDIFTKGNLVYRKATASITLGLGVKTEGNLVISGTRGYVLVPSPWWLTNYFEVRYEDQNQNKKYFILIRETAYVMNCRNFFQ